MLMVWAKYCIGRVRTSFQGRRLDRLIGLVFAAALSATACSRKSSVDAEGAADPKIDPALARAIGRAVQPCIRAHQTPTASVYTAQLRLAREPSGTATASFLAGRSPGHEEFEACAVQAIRSAGISLAQATVLPVAFNFGPDR